MIVRLDAPFSFRLATLSKNRFRRNVHFRLNSQLPIFSQALILKSNNNKYIHFHRLYMK